MVDLLAFKMIKISATSAIGSFLKSGGTQGHKITDRTHEEERPL